MSHEFENTELTKEIDAMWRRIKTLTGGADGACGLGMNGNWNARSVGQVLTALRVKDSVFLDLGAGDGRVLFAATHMGASHAVGYELPENKGHSYVFEAIRKTIGVERRIDRKVSYLMEDFEKIKWTDERPLSVYSFWVAMPPNTQMHVLRIAATAPNLNSLSICRDRNWRSPEQVIDAFSRFGRRRIALVAEIPINMYCSGHAYTVWVFAPVR
jgi:hypothetical protein